MSDSAGRASGALAAVVVVIACAAASPAADASVICSRSPSGVLRIVPYENRKIDIDFASATVRRSGDRLIVSDPPSPPVDCRGGSATVSDTKRIVFLQTGLSFATVQLEDWLPAPPVEFRTLPHSVGYGIVSGTQNADDWTLGGNASRTTLSVDPDRPGDHQFVYDGSGHSVATANGRAGDDEIDASRVEDSHLLTLLEGGEGNDTLLGSRFRDALVGGPGADTLEAGAGKDSIDSRDGETDNVVDCGGGDDEARADKSDPVSGCESVSYGRYFK
jgi:Ca2+-binding RTX toxin-like protein